MISPVAMADSTTIGGVFSLKMLPDSKKMPPEATITPNHAKGDKVSPANSCAPRATKTGAMPRAMG